MPLHQVPMKSVSKSCEFCGKTFSAKPSEINRGYGKYCSRSCSAKAQFTKVRQQKQLNCICAYCNTLFYRPPSKHKNSKSGLLFCSRKCKDTAQRIEGIPEIHPPHYKEGIFVYRQLALRYYGAKCLRCGYNRCVGILEVHHKNRDRCDNRLENLEVLCPTCHCEEHFLTGTGKWQVK